MINKINWGLIWENFDIWMDREESKPKCNKCGHIDIFHPDWEQQQKQVEQLVNNQIQMI